MPPARFPLDRQPFGHADRSTSVLRGIPSSPPPLQKQQSPEQRLRNSPFLPPPDVEHLPLFSGVVSSRPHLPSCSHRKPSPFPIRRALFLVYQQARASEQTHFPLPDEAQSPIPGRPEAPRRDHHTPPQNFPHEFWFPVGSVQTRVLTLFPDSSLTFLRPESG